MTVSASQMRPVMASPLPPTTSVEAGRGFRQEVEEQLAHEWQGCGAQSGTAWAAQAVISDKIPSFPDESRIFITTARLSAVTLPCLDETK